MDCTPFYMIYSLSIRLQILDIIPILIKETLKGIHVLIEEVKNMRPGVFIHHADSVFLHPNLADYFACFQMEISLENSFRNELIN